MGNGSDLDRAEAFTEDDRIWEPVKKHAAGAVQIGGQASASFMSCPMQMDAMGRRLPECRNSPAEEGMRRRQARRSSEALIEARAEKLQIVNGPV